MPPPPVHRAALHGGIRSTSDDGRHLAYVTHGKRHHALSLSASCATCRATDAATESMTPAPSRRPRLDGQRHNDAIDAALQAAGFASIIDPIALVTTPLKMIYVREMNFAPPRGWDFDFGFPFATPRFAIEREGQAHAIKRQRFADQEKHNEATRRGWLVYRVTTPEEAVSNAIAAVGSPA